MLFYSKFRQYAIKKILERRKLVNRHVYTQAFVQPDNTTKVFICIDGVKIMQVTNRTTSQGDTPAVLCSNAQIVIDYLKRQYYITNRRSLLNPRVYA